MQTPKATAAGLKGWAGLGARAAHPSAEKCHLAVHRLDQHRKHSYRWWAVDQGYGAALSHSTAGVIIIHMH